jgi:hypothetical protein
MGGGEGEGGLEMVIEGGATANVGRPAGTERGEEKGWEERDGEDMARSKRLDRRSGREPADFQGGNERASEETYGQGMHRSLCREEMCSGDEGRMREAQTKTRLNSC